MGLTPAKMVDPFINSKTDGGVDYIFACILPGSIHASINSLLYGPRTEMRVTTDTRANMKNAALYLMCYWYHAMLTRNYNNILQENV